MKKSIIIFALILSLLIIPFSIAVNAEEPEIYEDAEGFKYELSENGEAYILVGAPSEEEIVVPNEFNGKPVAEIGSHQEPFRSRYGLNQVIKFSENNYKIDGFYLNLNHKSLKYNEYKNGKYLGTVDNPYYVLMDVTNKDTTEFYLHNDTEVIADYAFLYVRNLEKVVLSPNLKYVGEYAFVTDMIVNNHEAVLKCKEYENGLYLGTSNNPYHLFLRMVDADAETVTIHEKTKVIAPTAFRSGFYDGSQDVSTTVKTADKLKKIMIPDRVESICENAFASLPALEEIDFGMNQDGYKILELGGIDESVNLVWNATIPVPGAPEIFTDENGYKFQLNETGEHYILVETPHVEEVVIPAEFNGKPVCGIYSGSDVYKTNKSFVKKIYLTENIRDVETYSFNGLLKFEFNKYENGRYIGTKDNPYYALIYVVDDGSDELVLHEDTEIIAKHAFESVCELKKITISDSLKYVNHIDFYCQPWQMPYFMGLNYTEYENGLYLGTENNPYHLLVRLVDADVESVTIHEDTKVISSLSFSADKYGESSEFNEIKKAEKLKEITIPKSVISIKETAFEYCSALETLNFESESPEHFEILEFGNIPENVKLNWGVGSSDEPEISTDETSDVSDEVALETSNQSSFDSNQPKEEDSDIWLFIGIGVGLVAGIIAVVFKSKKK